MQCLSFAWLAHIWFDFCYLFGFQQDLAQVEELDSCAFTADAGKNNVNKNRYRDILPCKPSEVFHFKYIINSIAIGHKPIYSHLQNLYSL